MFIVDLFIILLGLILIMFMDTFKYIFAGIVIIYTGLLFLAVHYDLVILQIFIVIILISRYLLGIYIIKLERECGKDS